MTGWKPAMAQAESTALPAIQQQFQNTQNSPLWQGAKDWATRTMDPSFVDPRNNPYFQGALDDTLGSVRGNTAAMFSRAGRGTSNNASGLGGYFTDTATRALAPTLAGMYQQNQGLQAGAAGMAPSLVADPALQQYLQNVSGLAGLGQNGTTTTTASPSTLQMISGIAGMGLGAFSAPAGGTSAAQGLSALFAGSDERLKTDIERIGEDPRGFGVYRFRYVWEDEGVSHVGVMAQEMLHVMPDAVAMHPSGFLMVNYGAL